MNKTYRVAVIGRTGKGNYGHGLDVVWLGMDNVKLVAMADDDDKGRAEAAKRLSAPQAYADYREMLEKERPQIVSVASRWLDKHREMVVACAQHGASIFLEKPLCPNLVQADEMVAACEKHHVKVAIAHQTRYSPRLHRIKELIDSGRVGDLVEIRCRGKEDARGGGEDLMVLGTHLMDMMRFIAGDPVSCFAQVFKQGRPAVKADIVQGPEGMGPILGDRITSMYTFAKGLAGYFGTHKAQHGASARFAMQIFGSKGSIHVETGNVPAAFLNEDPSWAPGKSKSKWQEITSDGIGKSEPFTKDIGPLGNRWIVKDLIESIEQDRQPLGSIYDGRAALEMILAVYESFRLKGPVSLPLKNRQHPLEVV